MATPWPSVTKTFHRASYPAIDPRNLDLSAQGKVVLVTGGGSGIGESIATAFTIAGARAVAILGRTTDTLESAAQELSALSKTVLIRFFAVDVRDTNAIAQVFKAVRAELGGVDVLVNNAGYLSTLDTIENSNIDDYWLAFETNVKGTLNVVQAFLRLGRAPAPAQNLSLPTIINVSTAGVHLPYIPGYSSYAASKIAAWRLIEYVAFETKGSVRVFSIHPGWVETEMTRKAQINAVDDFGLPGAFDFLQGRLVWCNWDVLELLDREEEIVRNDLFTLELSGWA